MLKVGIVGCGNHAHTHAEAIVRHPKFQFIACVDVHEDRARAFADTYGIPNVYGSISDLVLTEIPDLLIIAAFPAIHKELVKQAVAKGVKAVLCEKPLAMSLDEALEIQEFANRHGAFVMEGLMYRAHPQIHKAYELVQSGSVGEVKYIHGMFTDYVNDASGNWRNDPKLGGGSMTAKGCYLVDACNLFSGSSAVSAFAIESVDPIRQVEVGITGTIVYENGVIGHIETNHRSSWREEIRITGTKGTLIIPHAIVTKQQPRHIVLERNGHYEFREVERERMEFPAANAYALQLDSIYNTLRHGEQPSMPLDSSINNYRVTDALLRSAKTGKLERVPWESQ